jgi:hypothetical protein
MPETPQRPKLTIEDLLRLKRAERPTAEFWTHFEQELRAKQLAAIVEKPSRWRAGIDALMAWRMPIGAAIAVALVSYLSIRPVSEGISGSPVASVPQLQPLPQASVPEIEAVIASVQDETFEVEDAVGSAELMVAAVDAAASESAETSTAAREDRRPSGGLTLASADTRLPEFVADSSIPVQMTLAALDTSLVQPVAMQLPVTGDRRPARNEPLEQLAAPQVSFASLIMASPAVMQDVVETGPRSQRTGVLYVSESSLRDLHRLWGM